MKRSKRPTEPASPKFEEVAWPLGMPVAASMTELVDVYVRYRSWLEEDDGYYRDMRYGEGDDYWSQVALGHLTDRYPGLAWKFVLAVLARNLPFKIEEDLIIGTLTDLLNRHGDTVADWVVKRIEADPSFSEVAAGAYAGYLSPEVRQKLAKAIQKHDPHWSFY